MERSITVSDDIYKELLRMRSNRSFSEILGEMIWRKGNLKTEIKKVEEEFHKWI
jgi:predicted CopG family antitoxin